MPRAGFGRAPLIISAWCAMAVIAVVEARASAPSVNPIFEPIIAALKASTTVSTILLPSRLPPDFPKTILANLGSSGAPLDYYQVVLSTESGCNLEACETASIFADPVNNRPSPIGEKIRLRDGTTAYYDHFVCNAAGCHESQITFDKFGVRYVVGVKAGRRRDVEILATDMAAIKN